MSGKQINDDYGPSLKREDKSALSVYGDEYEDNTNYKDAKNAKMTISDRTRDTFDLVINTDGKETALYIPYIDCHKVLELINEFLQSKGIKSDIKRTFNNNKKEEE